MDKLTPAQRHKAMKHVKSKNTSIEMTLRRALWKHGFRYRINYKKLPGKPDIVFLKRKIAVFCDSEFFHGKDWEHLKVQLEGSKNRDYWIKKISRNMERDRAVDKELRFAGWTVVRFWGKEIMKDPDGCVRTIEEIIFEKALSLGE